MRIEAQIESARLVEARVLVKTDDGHERELIPDIGNPAETLAYAKEQVGLNAALFLEDDKIGLILPNHRWMS